MDGAKAIVEGRIQRHTINMIVNVGIDRLDDSAGDIFACNLAE
jgi:hypothetical protein